MLKPEDCRPGVEVIAIKNTPPDDIKPPLSIGMIYTIKHLAYSAQGRICVALHEVDGTGARYGIREWGYFLWQLKLRDVAQFQSLFNLNDIPQWLKHEVLEDETV